MTLCRTAELLKAHPDSIEVQLLQLRVLSKPKKKDADALKEIGDITATIVAKVPFTGPRLPLLPLLRVPSLGSFRFCNELSYFRYTIKLSWLPK